MRTCIAVAAMTVVTAGLAFGASAHAADAASKAKFDAVCSECHESEDYAGESAADLETKIKGIVAGTVKHKKKLALTEAEAKAMAQFMATGGK